MEQAIKDKYYQMVSEIEDAKIYDGRGIFDMYKCERCGNVKITTYSVKGVTPFCIGCSCGEMMGHTESYSSVPSYVEVDKWVRPTFAELKYLSKGQLEHVLNGGLLLNSQMVVIQKHMCHEATTMQYIDHPKARLEPVFLDDKSKSQPWRKRGKNCKC